MVERELEPKSITIQNLVTIMCLHLTNSCLNGHGSLCVQTEI